MKQSFEIKFQGEKNAKLQAQGNMPNGGTFAVNGDAHIKGILQNDSNIILKQGMNATLAVYQTLLLHSGTEELNDNLLQIFNAATDALQTIDGKIIAEHVPGMGKVRWHIGKDTGHYVIPFAKATIEDVTVETQILIAGTGANGYLEFGTYGTGNDNEALLQIPDKLTTDFSAGISNFKVRICKDWLKINLNSDFSY